MEERDFGKYVLLEHMGKGGVGSVYRAREKASARIVAVKVFRCTERRPVDLTRRLRDREVRMLLGVQHPNIVRFYETGEVGDDFYYAMEFVENSLLSCLRGQRDFDLLNKVRILRQAASALAAIHHQGIVHRDVKPGNILLEDGEGGFVHVKLTDLGIAKSVSETDIVRQQRDGRIPGTPKYLAPEQVAQLPLDGRADIFSLGVVGYQLLTGELPFDADDAEGYMAANVEQQQRPAVEVAGEMPPFLSRMLDRMLAKDREKRYDADTLERDLLLGEQHLISGASLVERTNPASMFYQGPAEPAEEPEHVAPISPYAWLAALGMVVAGVLIAMAAWPKAASVPAAGPPAPTPAKPADALQEAAAQNEAGRHWAALAILRGLESAELTAQQAQTAHELRDEANAALAQLTYAEGMQMLDQGRVAEARIVLARLRRLAPASQWLDRLEEKLRAQSRETSAGERWQRAMSDTYELVRLRLYGEALDARMKLLQELGAEPELVARTRQAIADLVQAWAEHLLNSGSSHEKLRQFLEATEPLELAPPLAALAARVRMELAKHHARAERFGDALPAYRAVERAAPAELAEEASEALKQLLERMSRTPMDAQRFAETLRAAPFAEPLWQETVSGGSAEVGSQGQVHMRTTADDAQVRLGTLRPVRNLGFTVSVRLRASPAPAEKVRAGLRVSDVGGKRYDLVLSGESVQLISGSARPRGGQPVSRSGVDEQGFPHVLCLGYEFDTGLLLATVDGQRFAESYVHLGDVRFELFLEALGPAEVTFSEFAFEP